MEFGRKREGNSLSDRSARTSCGQFEVYKRCGGRLIFPPEHELSLLWTIWTGQRRAENLSLRLCSEEEKQLPLDEEQLAQAGQRVYAFLSQIARVRLRQIADGASLDEHAVVFVSCDNMVAWMLLLPPVGEGKRMRASEIHHVLAQRGVVYGIRWNQICGLSESPQRYFHIFTIACGKPPIPGDDGAIEDCYPRVLEANIQVDELGEMDYEALHLVQDIQKDEVICRVVPAKKGRDGRAVTGEVIQAVKGKPAEVPQGRNTDLSEDGSCLLAARDGHLYFSGRSFHVKPVLHLYEDQFPEENSIKFLGDIHIHGDLSREVSIYAIGNVQIDGVMEASTVDAGENIIVSRGVQGQDRAVLHAQKSVYAKYLEHCTVYAQDSVQADCIINCGVYSNGDVRVCTGRGVIVGGNICAAREVSATTVGSKAERETRIVLGGKPCEEAEQMEIEKEIRDIDRQLDQLYREVRPDQVQVSAKLRLKQCVAKMKLLKIEKDLKAHDARGQETDLRCLVFDTVYPGTYISIGSVSAQIDDERHNCALCLVDGGIRRVPMTKP